MQRAAMIKNKDKNHGEDVGHPLECGHCNVIAAVIHIYYYYTRNPVFCQGWLFTMVFYYRRNENATKSIEP